MKGKNPLFANLNFLIFHFGLVYVKENLKARAIREIREGRASYWHKLLPLATRKLGIILNII